MSTTLLLGMAWTIGAPALKPLPNPEVIVGEWRLIDSYHAGKSDFELQRTAIDTVRITQDDWSAISQGRVCVKSAIRVDTKNRPAQIDIGVPAPNQPGSLLGIFKIEGDTLTVAYDDAPNARPTKFESPRTSSIQVLIFQRIKP